MSYNEGMEIYEIKQKISEYFDQIPTLQRLDDFLEKTKEWMLRDGYKQNKIDDLLSKYIKTRKSEIIKKDNRCYFSEFIKDYFHKNGKVQYKEFSRPLISPNKGNLRDGDKQKGIKEKKDRSKNIISPKDHQEFSRLNIYFYIYLSSIALDWKEWYGEKLELVLSELIRKTSHDNLDYFYFIQSFPCDKDGFYYKTFQRAAFQTGKIYIARKELPGILSDDYSPDDIINAMMGETGDSLAADAYEDVVQLQNYDHIVEGRIGENIAKILIDARMYILNKENIVSCGWNNLRDYCESFFNENCNNLFLTKDQISKTVRSINLLVEKLIDNFYSEYHLIVTSNAVKDDWNEFFVPEECLALKTIDGYSPRVFIYEELTDADYDFIFTDISDEEMQYMDELYKDYDFFASRHSSMASQGVFPCVCKECSQRGIRNARSCDYLSLYPHIDIKNFEISLKRRIRQVFIQFLLANQIYESIKSYIPNAISGKIK